MTNRSSTIARASNAAAAIKQSQLTPAGDFERAPSAVKSKKKKGPEYDGGNVVAARSGELANKMLKVWARDSQLDPGVEEVEVVQVSDEFKREAAAALQGKEAKALRAQGFNVIQTKSGAVQARHTKQTGGRPGTIKKTLAAPARQSGGRFAGRIKETRVVDPDRFKEAARRRVKGYGSSLFKGNLTEARRAALLASLQKDRERRGWQGVPDLD